MIYRMKHSSKKYDVREFRVDSTIALGDKVRVILISKTKAYEVCILDLSEVAGYLNNTHETDSIDCIRIDEPGGVYCFDISLRLNRKEVQEYPEVFIFKEGEIPNIVFRAVAKDIQFKILENGDQSLRNAHEWS